MEAGTGIITPQEKAEIIISIIPSINQVGREIDLINNINVEAKDTFTKKNLKYQSKVIKSGAIKGVKDTVVVSE